MKNVSTKVITEVSSTLRLSNDLKKKLVKIGAKMSLKDGKVRSMEDIIEALVKEHEDKEASKE
jgi:hypothetical protein